MMLAIAEATTAALMGMKYVIAAPIQMSGMVSTAPMAATIVRLVLILRGAMVASETVLRYARDMMLVMAVMTGTAARHEKVVTLMKVEITMRAGIDEKVAMTAMAVENSAMTATAAMDGRHERTATVAMIAPAAMTKARAAMIGMAETATTAIVVMAAKVVKAVKVAMTHVMTATAAMAMVMAAAMAVVEAKAVVKCIVT